MNMLNKLSRQYQELTPGRDIVDRIKTTNWKLLSDTLDEQGFAVIENLVAPEECEALAGLYPQNEIFRNRVVMERHGFGRGEYKYFSYPLPDIISELRTFIYERLAPTANRWNEGMRVDVQYPVEHAEYIERCHGAGQRRPTPLLLQYKPGDYNCLHQDVYGEHVFPIQLTILLSEPGRDISQLFLTYRACASISYFTIGAAEL